MTASPRTNSTLLGHEKVERQIAEAVAAGHLPHGIILGGEWGIGKATLAFRLAKYLLSPEARLTGSLEIEPGSATARRVGAQSHGDLIVVERETDASTGKQARDVSVEDIRKVAPFLRLTASEGGWRIAIIDDASFLNRAGQNALLKILEEPPPRSVLILVCDRPGLLLPTIHSRCRLIRLAPLVPATLETLLRSHAPELDAEQRPAIVALAEGSLGRALRLVENDGLPLYGELAGLLETLPDPDWPAVHAFADRLGSPAAEPSYRLFTEFLSGWLTRLVRTGAGERVTDILPGDTAQRQRLLGLSGLDRWIDACENIAQRLTATDSANLDRRLAVWSVFETLARLGARSAA